MKIWTDDAIEIVKINWETKTVEEIRLMVYEHCVKVAKIGKPFLIPTRNSPIWQAWRSGLITESERNKLCRNNKRKPLPNATRTKVIKRDKNKCVICHSIKHLEVDHIKPVMLGGSDEIVNLQTLCNICHKIKGLQTIDGKNLKDCFEVCLTPAKDGTLATIKVKKEWPDQPFMYQLLARHMEPTP